MPGNVSAIHSAGSVHKTDDATRRLRQRYAFEARFKMLGLLAIAIAVAALAALLWTVVGNAVGALRQSYVRLPVFLPAADIDPQATNDPQVIRSAEFSGIMKSALRSAVPYVKGRSDKRKLYALLSDGAALDVRAQAMANPAVIGQTKDYELLLSDDADLWLKGYMGAISELPHSGSATPSGNKGRVKITAGANAFAAILQRVKDGLKSQAADLRKQAAAQQNGVTAYQTLLAGSPPPAADILQRYQALIAGFKSRRDGFIEQAQALEQSAKSSSGSMPISSSLPSFFVRINGGVIKAQAVSSGTLEGEVIFPLSGTDTAENSQWQLLTINRSELARRISDKQAIWLEKLKAEGRVSSIFNWRFLTDSNSREAELAGVWGAAVGSFWTMLVTFTLAFPIGTMAAIYLEEFAPKNRWTDFIEVNVNNLAAVPSIVFGLLGLAVFIGLFGVPRSTALAGGIVLALMTMPTIMIAGRAAIRAVPPSIREAALGVGASKVQTVTHHVLPLAMPGILTGSIIGMAQALGETAPLLMIGMFAFIREVPIGVLEPATALPVQIYQWSDFPERMFNMKTAAAILVLLTFLVVMNGIAIILRKRFERRW